jgi:acetate kinase
MGDESVLVAGAVERIGEDAGHSQHRIQARGGEASNCERSRPVADHREGLKHIFAVLGESGITGCVATDSAARVCVQASEYWVPSSFLCYDRA